jgi:hypothetical protein
MVYQYLSEHDETKTKLIVNKKMHMTWKRYHSPKKFNQKHLINKHERKKGLISTQKFSLKPKSCEDDIRIDPQTRIGLCLGLNQELQLAPKPVLSKFQFFIF